MKTAPIVSKVWSFCTSLGDDGVRYGEGLPFIGQLPGHRRVETTARYAHLAGYSVREPAGGIAPAIL